MNSLDCLAYMHRMDTEKHRAQRKYFYRHRSSKTGRFVKASYVKRWPHLSVSEKYYLDWDRNATPDGDRLIVAINKGKPVFAPSLKQVKAK